MAWTRLPDCNGFARWRCTEPPRLGGQILASPSAGMIVAFDGLVFGAEQPHELEDFLSRVFERVDWNTYRDLLAAVRQAWKFVGHESLEAPPVRSPSLKVTKLVPSGRSAWGVKDFDLLETRCS